MHVREVLITFCRENRNHGLKRSVSCVMFWLPDVPEHWERKNSWRTWTGHSYKQYFKSESGVFEVNFIYMDSENIKLKTLSDRRFGSIILLFRLAGIPFHIKEMSIIYAIYMRTVIFCASTSYLGMFFDVYVHRDDLVRTTTNMRVLITVTNSMWIYTYCRYVTTLTKSVTATHGFVYQTQYYSYNNCYKPHKFITVDIMPNERCLFHTLTTGFRVCSVYVNALKNFIGYWNNIWTKQCLLETRTKHKSVIEDVTSKMSSLFHT
jgi:hypothetical protein